VHGDGRRAVRRWRCVRSGHLALTVCRNNGEGQTMRRRARGLTQRPRRTGLGLVALVFVCGAGGGIVRTEVAGLPASGQTITRLADGRLLALGGQSEGGVTARGALVDPVTGMMVPFGSGLRVPRA